MPIDVRPLTEADVPAARAVSRAALMGVAKRLDAHPHEPPPDNPVRGEDRVRRGVLEDPAGSFVVDRDGQIVGIGLAIRRDGLWMLSLLAVADGLQGQGIGRRLLDAVHETAHDATSELICVSRDPRAIRRYHALGFTLHPGYYAKGTLDRSLLPAGLDVREGNLDAHGELVDDVVSRLRGSGDALVDVGWAIRWGAQLLIAEDGPGRGFALVRDGDVMQLGATDDALAQRLLWAALETAKPNGEAQVGWLTGTQQWAIDIAMAARLTFTMDGSIAMRGAIGPFTPYLPSGGFG